MRLQKLTLAASLAALAVGCSSTEQNVPKPKPEAPAGAPEGPGKQQPGQQAPKDPPGDDKPGGGGGGGGNQVLDDLYKDLGLRDKEKRALAEHYFKVGKQYYDQLDYAEAAKNFQKAVDADANDKKAQQYYLMASLLAGDRVAEFKAITERLRDERGATIEENEVELRRLHDEGMQLIDRHEYDKAIVRFEQVLEKIRWFPYPVKDAGIEKSARENIIRAKKLKRDQELQEKISQEQKALDQAKNLEADAQQHKRDAISKRLNDGIEYLQTDKFQKAEDTFDKVLKDDPTNEQAQKFLELAKEGRHWHEDAVNHDRNALEMKWNVENMEEEPNIYTPTNKVVMFPEDIYWREKVQRRGIGLQSGNGPTEPAWVTAYKQKLATQKLTFNFNATPFNEVVDFLRDFTGINIIVSKAIDGEQVKLDLRLKDVIAQNAIDIILNQTGFAMSFKNEALMITPKEEAKGEYSLDIYDVQDILAAIPDFPGPRIRITAPRAGGGRGQGGGALTIDDEPTTDENPAVIEPDKLEQLVKNSTGADEVWGDPASYELHRGQIIVNQTREVHEKIKLVLENLRRNIGLFVQVECRFILIHNDFLQDIGVDYRGLGASDQGATPPLPIWGTQVNMDQNIPGQSATRRGGDDVGFFQKIRPGRLGPVLGGIPFFGSSAIGGRIENILDGGDAYFKGDRLNGTQVQGAANPKGFLGQLTILDPFQINAIIRADQERLKEKIVNAPVVVAANRQRVHISIITQRAYIADYELSSGGTGLVIAEVASPIVQTMQEGVVLDVRPTISADRKYVTLDLRPSLSELVGGVFTEIPVNLGTQTAAAINVNIELPTVDLREAYTSVMVPDGGTVLVGGFREFNEKEQRSGTPFVDDVPLLNVIFKREAELRETESLVILVTARIVVLRDEEKKRFNTK
ncbi:MAG TPA: hypothetical protein VFF73_35110 [Planctomycetota bacterium]|nr:hypothetical protein [Planctomycetota bacterium]